MRKVIDRTGEKNYNTFGSEMIIIEYKNVHDIDVYFPEYDWVFKNAKYINFKNGSIKCPYERRYYGVGYLGEGKYKVKENGRVTRVYDTWHSMLQRCYGGENRGKRSLTYIGCEVCEEWLNYQNFAEWYDNNYYTVKNEVMCLDKDILVKHNKIYSPETCVFVPNTINSLFTKRQNTRGKSVIGTSPHQGKYEVQCRMINPETGKSKKEYLGVYGTQEKGFEVYKYYKEKNIKQVADYFKDKIPVKLYGALYNYEVEITD